MVSCENLPKFGKAFPNAMAIVYLDANTLDIVETSVRENQARSYTMPTQNQVEQVSNVLGTDIDNAMLDIKK